MNMKYAKRKFTHQGEPKLADARLAVCDSSQLPTSVNLLAAASGNFGSWLPCWWPPETTPLTWARANTDTKENTNLN